jgi:hypothetical protein
LLNVTAMVINMPESIVETMLQAAQETLDIVNTVIKQ